MFRIGEFSKLTQVSIRMLRYYNEVGLLKPERTDQWTNYRLYSADQIPVLNKIIFLRDLGFNISEIITAIDHWDNDDIARRLEDKRLDIETQIKESQDRLAKIGQAKQVILKEKISMNCNVVIKAVPSYQVLSLRRIVPDYYSEGQLWKEMTIFSDKNHITLSNETFTIYHDEDYKEKDIDMEICAYVDKMGDGYRL